MKINAITSSIVCCAVLSSNEADAYQNPNIYSEIAVINSDERVLLEDGVVRKCASQFAIETKRLLKNSRVEVIEEDGQWAKIKVNEEVGYIELEKIKRVNSKIEIKHLDGIECLDVYSEMSNENSKKIGRIENGEKVFVIEELGEYIRIRWNDKDAYIKNIKGRLVKSIQKTIKEDTLMYSNLTRKTDNKEIPKGEVVEVKGVLKDYYKVSYNNEIGYIKQDMLKEVKYVGVQNLNAIKLYVKADDNSDIRTYIPSGSDVDVLYYEGEYAYVQYGDYNGYIKFDNLSNKEIELVDVYGENIVSSDVVDRKEIEGEYNRIQKEIEDKEKYSKLIDELKEKFGLVEIQKDSKISILKNRGRYKEVLVDGNRYYIDNVGIDVNEELSELTYIQTYPRKDVKEKTRYINKMDAEVYLNEDKKLILGLLVEDAQVEFIKNMKNGVSKVLINGCEVYVETNVLSVDKMYSKVEEKIESVKTGKSHKAFVKAQSKKLNINMKKSGAEKATINELAYYSNPKKNSVRKNDYKYQYLKLDEFKMINAKKLNDYLNSLPGIGNRKNVFNNKADVFVASAKKYNINPVYLISHALLETGKGRSNLAQGKKYEDNVRVYNFFGIGAIDSNPLKGGQSAAYRNGWTSVEATIEGSAKWLAKNYIHLNKNKQNTLYKMRYNYMTRSHQYATDIAWAVKISRYMNELSYLYEDVVLEFEVPVYKDGTYMPGVKNDKNKSDKENANSNKKPEKEERPKEEIEVKPEAEEKPKEEIEVKPEAEEKPKEEVETKPEVEEKPKEEVETEPEVEEKPKEEVKNSEEI